MELGSAAGSHHLSCQAFHHSAQLENEEKTQVGISLRDPDAFHKNKQGSVSPSLVSVSLFLCECVIVSISGSLGLCVCVCVCVCLCVCVCVL